MTDPAEKQDNHCRVGEIINQRTSRFELPDPMPINEQAVLANAKSCPFCGSDDLTMNQCSVDDGKVDTIECNECLGSALASSWNNRVEDTLDELVTACGDTW